MLITVLWTVILMVATLSGYLQAGTLDDIRVLEAGKTSRNASAPAMNALSLPENRAIITKDRLVPNEPPARYSLSDGRKVNLQDWKVVLFMQSTCEYCRQLAPVLKTFSQQTGFEVFPISLDGMGDAEFPDILPATPDVMVEYFQSGLPVATPTTFLTNVHTMETWPLLQGSAAAGEFRSRFNDVLRMAVDRQSGKNTPLNTQEQR